jgi:hypothetical protein
VLYQRKYYKKMARAVISSLQSNQQQPPRVISNGQLGVAPFSSKQSTVENKSGHLSGQYI